MSSISFLVLADSASDLKPPATSEPSPSASASQPCANSSLNGGQASLFTTTLPSSTEANTEAGSMSSAEASPASQLASLERDWATKMTAGSGLTCSALWRSPSRLGSLVRTCLASTGWVSTKQLMVWRPLATKSRRRLKFRLTPLGPTTSDSASGSVPTPNATAFKGGRLKPRKGHANPERNNYQDFCSLVLGMRYPLPEFGEQIMGYPLGWTFAETWRSETPSSRRSQLPSAKRSSKLKVSRD